jgi:hypothetical protein
MTLFKLISLYLLVGVLMNLWYDVSISYLKNEDLRFSALERVFFTIIWPLYLILIIINIIKSIINGSDE